MSPPKSCVIFDVGFFDFEKMMFLEIFDMYLMIFDINSKYLVKIHQYSQVYSCPPVHGFGIWIYLCYTYAQNVTSLFPPIPPLPPGNAGGVVWGDAVPPSKINYLMSVSVRFGICFGLFRFALKPYSRCHNSTRRVKLRSLPRGVDSSCLDG